MKLHKIYADAYNEYTRAKSIHPEWPDDKIHQVAIVCEESGEALKAVLDHEYHGKPLQDVKTELIQTLAMCIRCLENIA